MARKKTKQKLIIGTVIAIVVIVSVLGTVLFLKLLVPKAPDPYTESDTSQTTEPEPQAEPKDSADTSSPDTATSSNETQLNPSEVSTIDIEPLGIAVSYKKGIGPFEYEVLRTPNGTKYVEFRSQALAGTKCTNDLGPFVSILVSPSSAEMATVTKQETLDSTVYGLSLASDTCTSDNALLSTYQSAFSDAFYLLKKID